MFPASVSHPPHAHVQVLKKDRMAGRGKYILRVHLEQGTCMPPATVTSTTQQRPCVLYASHDLSVFLSVSR